MRYVVTGRAAAIHGGVLELSEDQARRRLHNLAALGNGRYRVVSPVEFKAGEAFGYDGELPKSMADCLAPADESGKPVAKKAKDKK